MAIMRSVGLAVLAFLLAPVAGAGPITFCVEGVVELTQGPLLPELLAGANAADLIGETVISWITFDGSAADGNGSPNIGSYLSSGAPFGLVMQFPHRTFSFDDVAIGVLSYYDNGQFAPGLLTDLWSAEGRWPGTILAPTFRGLIQLGEIGTAMVGPSTALVDDSLPLVPPDMTTFDDLSRMLVNAIDANNDVRGGIVANISRISLVHESATWSLLAAATGVLLLPRRRRKLPESSTIQLGMVSRSHGTKPIPSSPLAAYLRPATHTPSISKHSHPAIRCYLYAEMLLGGHERTHRGCLYPSAVRRGG